MIAKATKPTMSELQTRIADALKASFENIVEDLSGTSFDRSGVSMPGDEVWQRYAAASLSVQTTQDERDAVIEECARRAEALDRGRYEWVKDSLWANIKRDTAADIRTLKGRTPPTRRLVGVPAGWKFAPTEPTEEMTERGASSTCSLTVHGARGVYLAMLAQAPEHRGTDIEADIASVVQSVCDWDDRTSPDDYPGHLLITSEELTLLLRNFAASLAATAMEAGPDG